MPETLKNFINGMVDVFLFNQPVRGYRLLKKSGFAEDATNLAGDRRIVASDLKHVIRRVGKLRNN